jgi:hypothetical protein
LFHPILSVVFSSSASPLVVASGIFLCDSFRVMDDITNEVSWHSQLERVISDEGERCLCFSWLHSKSQKMFSKLNTMISIPVIVMSTIAGSASIGSANLFNNSTVAGVSIGAVSLMVGVLNTVSSYFGWAKRSEAHRIAAVTYEKVYRFILIELAMPREERMAAKDMLKVVRDQCDRLQETSPQIPDQVIWEFRKKFGDSTPDVKKPEITNGLDPIFVYSVDTGTPSRCVVPQNISEPVTPVPVPVLSPPTETVVIPVANKSSASVSPVPKRVSIFQPKTKSAV